jgi:hypothetical protein
LQKGGSKNKSAANPRQESRRQERMNLMFETKINPSSDQKSTVSALHRDCVVSGLQFKLLVQRYRSRMLFMDEERPLDRILIELNTIIRQLAAFPHRDDSVFPEHISSHVDRYLEQMDSERRYEGTR